MKNCLILVTNYFPYYKGEEYLESELPIIAQKFDTVFILSSMIDDNEKQTRQVPENVEVIPSGVSHKLMGRLKMISRGFTVKHKEENNKSLQQIFYSKYFESRALLISENFKQRLKKYNLNDYNNVTIYSYWLYVSARVSIELKKNIDSFSNAKIISRAHRYDLYEDVAPLKFLPERDYLLKNIDFIYPVSEDGYTYLTTNYPDFKDKIKVRKLGTIQEGEILNLSNTPFKLVSVSGIRKVKRIELIIDALSILEENNIDYEWTHLGDGPDYDKVVEYAKSKLNPKNFNFKGAVSNDKVFQHYFENQPSLFVNVSSSEGLPVSIMECMSVGIPAVATNVGGTSEIVKNTHNGYILSENVAPEEIARVFQTIKQLDTKEYEQLSNNAYLTWKDEYDAKKLYESFVVEALL